MNPSDISGAQSSAVTKIALHALFAVMGGLVRELAQEGTHSFIKFVGGGFIGMFCGLITYYICREWGCGENLTVSFVGLAGYIGTPLLDMLARWLRRMARYKSGD